MIEERQNGGIAFVTMVYNEAWMLPLWIRHHGALAGAQHLFVIDDGSDDGSTCGLGAVNVVRKERGDFDDAERANFVSDFHARLLQRYRWVIYLDCDEFVVVDPACGLTLPERLEGLQTGLVAPLGFNVVQDSSSEPDLDRSRSVLRQRKYFRFHAAFCKPTIASQRTRWTPGFHGADQHFQIDDLLLLLHLKYADRSHALSRLQVTRGIEWSERSLKNKMGAHQRVPDENLLQLFERNTEIISSGDARPFDMMSGIRSRANQGVARSDDRMYRQQDMFCGPIMKIPQRLVGCL